MQLHVEGLLIGICTFLIIGLFHPLVIKGEYHFGTRIWWVFLLAGLVALVAALLIESVFWASLLGVLAFSCFWSIKELFEQRKRVERGWFPKKTGRK